MTLSARLKSGAPESEPAADRSRLDRDTYNAIKSMVHFRLVEQLDLATITDLPRDALTASVREALEEITASEKVPLNRKEQRTLISDLINEILGLGPIEPLVNDPNIQDILVNGADQVYVEKQGFLYPVPVQFRDEDHLMM